MLSEELKYFIEKHEKDDLFRLALDASRYPEVDMERVIRQISGRRTAQVKIPSWACCPDILYPVTLSMEQCSSEATATYKAAFLMGESFADLSGGFGVDCAFIADKFRQVTYVEQNKELCDIVRHNFSVLGLDHGRVIHGDGIEWLQQMEPVDVIYLDPARRDEKGKKVFFISDCQPDVKVISDLLLEKARNKVVTKFSPMLDLTSALRELPFVSEVRIVSVRNECKELLLVMGREIQEDVSVHCVNIYPQYTTSFVCHRREESSAVCRYTDRVENYLYEPDTSLLKAGVFKLPAVRFGLKKLHVNSHLYTADTLIPDFPGRVFQVDSAFSFGKKELKRELSGVDFANITVRNFPVKVEELRKKLKLKEGGNTYLFATTLADDKRVLIKCHKPS